MDSLAEFYYDIDVDAPLDLCEDDEDLSLDDMEDILSL